jgi:hypothetical protein
MRHLPALALTVASAVGLPAAAAAQGSFDSGVQLRLQNEVRWQQGQIRALEAESDRLRTDHTLRRLENQRQPDPTLSRRQAELDALGAQNLLRATQDASTATAARLRAGSPVYDQRLRDLGYASGLPLGSKR